jgi:hypothetical protein
LKVRVVDGQDGPADFCFLMSARKEVVGLTKSTYLIWAIWAGYLGNATRVIAYSMASSNHGLGWFGLNYTKLNFTSPGLKGKFDFRVIGTSFNKTRTRVQGFESLSLAGLFNKVINHWY